MHNTLANTLIVSMEKEFIVFQIKMFIWEIGKMINFMDKVFISIRMDKSTKENFNKE